MEGQKYPKAVEHLESWKCGNHLVQDPYLYMQNAKDQQVLSWVAEENAYTDHWFEDKNLGQRIQQLKSQQKKPTYHNLCQVGEKLYAVCSGTDGSSAAVEMKSDFSDRTFLFMGSAIHIGYTIWLFLQEATSRRCCSIWTALWSTITGAYIRA